MCVEGGEGVQAGVQAVRNGTARGRARAWVAAARTLLRARVDLGAVLEQHRQRIHVPERRRPVERRVPFVVGPLRVGASLEQHSDERLARVGLSERARVVERREAVLIDRVDLAAISAIAAHLGED